MKRKKKVVIVRASSQAGIQGQESSIYKTYRSNMQHTRSSAFRNPGFVIVGIIFTIVFIIAVGFTVATAVSAQSPESMTCTVSSKERVTEVRDGNSTTHLLINTEDCGTLEIGSAIVSGNWSPNQTYSSIKENETYKFEVYGFNVDAMNFYKQVKSVHQV